MLTRIIRHDLKSLVADRTLFIISIILTLLLAYALWNGASYTAARERQIRHAEGSAQRELAVQKQQVLDVEAGKKKAAEVHGLGRASGVNLAATLPASPLSILSLGASELMPNAATVNLFTTKDELVKQSELDNPVNLLTGRFDAAFLFVYLYPLLILALSYNLLSGEKEQGTLALTMAQPVSLAKLVIGKVIARASVLLGLAFIVTLIGLMINNVSLASESVFARFLLWFAGVAAYTIFWFALAIFINLLGKSSATNAALLAAAWLMLVVIYPALLNVAATTLHPLPSRLQFINDARDDEAETNREAKNLLAKYMNDHPELAGGDTEANAKDFYLRYFVQKQEIERRALQRADRYNAQLRHQQATIARFGFISPAITLQEAMNDTAGTSRHRHERFTESVRQFIDRVRDTYKPFVFSKSLLKADDYATVPRFTFKDETTSQTASRVGFKLLLLIVPTLILIGFIARQIKHYPLAN